MKSVASKGNSVEGSKSTAPPESKKTTTAEVVQPQQLNSLWHSMATHASESSAAGSSEPPPIQRQSAEPLLVQRVCAECEEDLSQGPDVIQSKLTVGAPNDEYEQEADAVAGRVMRMPSNDTDLDEELPQAAPQVQTKPLTTPFIQRLCAGCDDERADMGNPSVQTKTDGMAVRSTIPDTVKSTINTPGGGAPLSETVRSRIEPVLRADLSAVRVHTDRTAQTASRSLNAAAFTHRNNIFLGKGQRPTDIQLMAHEATHVVQQSSARRYSRPESSSVPRIQRKEKSAGVSTMTTSDLGICDNNKPNPIVWFKHNSTELRQGDVDSITHLMVMVRRAQQHLTAAGDFGVIYLYGFASEEGEPANNLALSMNRAFRVRQLLSDAGVPAERIVPLGLGENRANQSLEMNRRVEVCPTPAINYIDMDPMEIKVKQINCNAPPGKASSLNEYVQLVRCLENVLPSHSARKVLSFLRQKYYGGSLFGAAIPCGRSTWILHAALPHALDSALNKSQVVGGVDIGHLFTGLEAMMCPQSSVDFDIPWVPFDWTVNMPSVELVTWGGDLGSAAAIWTEEQFDKGRRTIASDHVGQPGKGRASEEDLRGDIDSYVLRSELTQKACAMPAVKPILSKPLSSILSDYYVSAPAGQPPSDKHRSRCFAQAIGGKVTGNTITNPENLVSRYKSRIYDFSYAFYYRRHKWRYVMGGVGKVQRDKSLLDKSKKVMREFVFWLQKKMT